MRTPSESKVCRSGIGRVVCRSFAHAYNEFCIVEIFEHFAAPLVRSARPSALQQKKGIIMSNCDCKKTASTPHFSKIGAPKGNSAVTEILALAARPEVISFGGGLPAPEGFPVKEIREACDWVLDHDAARALQYSSVQGMPEFRKALAERETQKGVPTTADNILIASGSQQALDMIGRLFIDPGAKVLVESPTYLGALQAFDLSQPSYTALPVDDEGLNPAAMGEECRGARFAYVMPTFQNPTGRTLSLERRKLLAEKAREYDFWLVEDNPYGELYYGAEPPVSMRALAPERTITLNSMSKVLSPGFRLGYIMAPESIISALCEMKTAVDLHSSTFTQLVTARVLNQGLMTNHLPMVRKLYKDHAECMLKALEDYMPKRDDISWTHPNGGMFVWLQLPENVDSTDLMKKCLASDTPVGFVPGYAFFAVNPRNNCCRLSFVTVPEEKIIAGVKSIAQALESML